MVISNGCSVEVVRRTRVVDCAECGEASAYVEVPKGSTIVSDGSANGWGTAHCLSCDHEFRVSFVTDDRY